MKMLTTYTCDDFRAIRQSTDIQTAADAAAIFAGRLARREYGRAGYVRTLRPDSWAMDGTSHTFEAFIGVDGQQPNETVGRNVWLHIHVR